MKVRTSDSLNRVFLILLEPENGVSSAFAWIIMSSVVTDGTYF